MGKITFNNADISFTLKNKRDIKTGLINIFTEEAKVLKELSIVFCSDEYLLNLNKSHLNHDYYTDILTFDLSDSLTEISGELYISVERVRDNASQMSILLLKELLRVIIHGCLHLCGYKDKKPSQIKVMRQKEDGYLENPMFHVEHIK
ncbi:MAG: rRNA maturation RNase YbeY [Ginsengibacter sp.]